MLRSISVFELRGGTSLRLPLLLLLVTLTGTLAFADVTGSILGTVSDANQGVLPNAEVTVTNLETNLRRTAKADAIGEYRILALPVGKYRVEATMAGFQKFLVSSVELTVNEQRRIDVVLQVGSVEQSVEVQAELAQVESTSSQLGDVVESKKMLALPLNGRSYIDLLGLQAGVAPGTSSTISQDRPVSGELNAG